MALDANQIARLWVREGGSPKYANLMARIALRESGGRPGVNNRGLNKNGTVDWGLFQVNDIWRKDPVVGPLFRSGAILTPQGNAKAAVHILKVQGPQAWATYNAATDRKYLGAFKGGARQVTTTTPGADNSGTRRQLLQAYLSSPAERHDPTALIRLFGDLHNAQDSPAVTSTRTVHGGGQGATRPGKAGIGHFDGKPVAGWIAPILRYARQHGWTGSVTSGFRSYVDQQRIYNSGVRPAAKPGTSNHEGDQFPRGAVDVSNASQLAAILRRSPYRNRLVWAGAKDPVHFSHPHDGGY